MKAILYLTLITLVSCSSNKEAKNIQKKMENSSVSDSKTLEVKIHVLIHKSQTLTDSQKAELEKIFENKRLRSEELTENSYKLRGVMIKELLAGPRHKKTIHLLKKEIEKVELLRLKNTFDTVDKISELLAPPVDNEEIFNHLLIDRSNR